MFKGSSQYAINWHLVPQTFQWLFADSSTGIFVGLLVLVIGYRMNANRSNLLLIIALVVLAQAVFRSPPLSRLDIDQRMLWTLGIMTVSVCVAWYFLWSKEITSKNCESYIKEWIKIFDLHSDKLEVRYEHNFGYDAIFRDNSRVTIVQEKNRPGYLLCFATIGMSDWLKHSYDHLVGHEKNRFYSKFKAEIDQAKLRAYADSEFRTVTVSRYIQISGLTGLSFKDTVEDVHSGIDLVISAADNEMQDVLKERGPVTPDNVEMLIRQWVESFNMPILRLEPNPEQYFGYAVLFSANEPINIFRRKDLDQCIMLEVTFPLGSLKEAYDKLLEEDRKVFWLELCLELAKAAVPCELSHSFERATIKRVIPISGLTQPSFADSLNRSHWDGVIVRDMIKLKLTNRH